MKIRTNIPFLGAMLDVAETVRRVITRGGGRGEIDTRTDNPYEGKLPNQKTRPEVESKSKKERYKT